MSARRVRHLSVELLKQSPSPALRACIDLAQVQPAVARDLFAASFVSCWTDLPESQQEGLVRALEAAFTAHGVPASILTLLLGLAEFMERDERPLPLEPRALGEISERCRAYAKALRYCETEFATQPAECVEALIAINTALGQPEAAAGVLAYAQANLKLEIKESWYEKLGRWEAALDSYSRRCAAAGPAEEREAARLGRMRCLAALAEWEELLGMAQEEWDGAAAERQKTVAPIAAQAAWQLGAWDSLSTFVHALPTFSEGPAALDAADRKALAAGASGGLGTSTDGDFYRAILAVRSGNFDAARLHVEAAREALASELATLAGESYERAYGGMVRAQQLTELDEVMIYAAADQAGDPAAAAAKRLALRRVWVSRIAHVRRTNEVWQSVLGVQALVANATDGPERVELWTTLAKLHRNAGCERQAYRSLVRMLQYDPALCPQGAAGYGACSGNPVVMLGYLKHLWATGRRQEAFMRLQDLAAELQSSSQSPDPPAPRLVAKTCLRLGDCLWELAGGSLDDGIIQGARGALRCPPSSGMFSHFSLLMCFAFPGALPRARKKEEREHSISIPDP